MGLRELEPARTAASGQWLLPAFFAHFFFLMLDIPIFQDTVSLHFAVISSTQNLIAGLWGPHCLHLAASR